jgi:RND family efflux transporter MFP subunit
MNLQSESNEVRTKFPPRLARHAKWLLPVGILAVAYAIAVVIRNAGPQPEVISPKPQTMVVRVVTAQPEVVQLMVDSQGEVEAEHTIDLVNEVAGRVSRVAPAFVAGGYFEAGDILLELDSTDYDLARIRAAAKVAEAREELEIEKSESQLAAQGLFPLREAKVASAEARLQSAQAELSQAAADLERTRVRAPFAGRVLTTAVDLGQYVNKGAPLGRIFSTAIAEVRLPLTDSQLRYLDLPFGSGSNEQTLDIPVTLRAEVGGRDAQWQGLLHRMEGAVDPENRVWYGVARVEDPYGLKQDGVQTPLVVGLFVEAEIAGRTVSDVYRLPRSALRNRSDVLIVDGESRLRMRKVDVLRTDFESVLVAEGFEAGEQVCVSPVEAFVDGLLVQTVQEESAADKLAVK